MKRLLMFFLALLCLNGPCAAAQDPDFLIDIDYVQAGMGRSYAQKYLPRISQDTLTIILPVESAANQGSIRAELGFNNPEHAPIRLPQELTQTLGRKAYNGKAVGPYVVQFKLKLHPDRLNGEYPYHILIQGQSASGQKISRRFDFLLRISDGQKNPQLPLPQLLSLSAEQSLRVGEKGSLKACYANGSQTRLLTGLRLKISDASGEVLPQGSDTIALDDLLPGAHGEVIIPVQVLDKASAQPHVLTLSLSAAHEDDAQLTESQQFTLPVYQEAKLRLGDSRLPQQVTQGENVAYTLNFMNMGKGKLNNILMRFELPGLDAGGSVLVGNLAAGESKLGSANLRVALDKLGALSGKLFIDYEDDYGKPYHMELPVNTAIKERPKPVFVAEEEKKAEENNEKTPADYLPWVIAGLFFVLLIVQSIVLRQKIRRIEEKNL
jgi:hypothetical protein